MPRKPSYQGPAKPGFPAPDWPGSRAAGTRSGRRGAVWPAVGVVCRAGRARSGVWSSDGALPVLRRRAHVRLASTRIRLEWRPISSMTSALQPHSGWSSPGARMRSKGGCSIAGHDGAPGILAQQKEQPVSLSTPRRSLLGGKQTGGPSGRGPKRAGNCAGGDHRSLSPIESLSGRRTCCTRPSKIVARNSSAMQAMVKESKYMGPLLSLGRRDGGLPVKVQHPDKSVQILSAMNADALQSEQVVARVGRTLLGEYRPPVSAERSTSMTYWS